MESDERISDDHAPAEAEAPERTDQPQARLVPVSESIRYRRRAQAAEQRLEELTSKLSESQEELEQVRLQLGSVERRQRIDQTLMESDAIDLEAARLLTEIAVQQMSEPDVQMAVADLRRRKPYLFRRGGGGGMGSTMSPRPRGSGQELDEAVNSATISGSRRDLLRYLRLRRRSR